MGDEPWQLPLAQLRTRRGVLLDLTQMNLTYVPEGAPGIEHIFQKVYGMSLLDPDGVRAFGKIGPVLIARAPEEWASIRKEFDVTDVLVPREWNLKLPRIAESEELALYAIPDPADRQSH